jgi:hypothetical protein
MQLSTIVAINAELLEGTKKPANNALKTSS